MLGMKNSNLALLALESFGCGSDGNQKEPSNMASKYDERGLPINQSFHWKRSIIYVTVKGNSFHAAPAR